MLRQVELPDGLNAGSLFLSSMPGRHEALDVFLAELATHSVGYILCLVADVEIAKKSPSYLTAIQSNAIPVTILRFDIPDYGLPVDPNALNDTLDLVCNLLESGESVVIHCAAGHGRTGMISVLLLARAGVPIDDAFNTIRKAGSACDTNEQRTFVLNHIGSDA